MDENRETQIPPLSYINIFSLFKEIYYEENCLFPTFSHDWFGWKMFKLWQEV